MGKMLFIRGGAVGDFILTLPAIQLVRDTLPDVEIDILGYESITRLAIDSGLAHRIRSIEHASLAPFFAPGAELDAETCAYFASFDVVISYLFDPDGFFAANLEKAGVETLIRGPYRMNEEEPFVPTSRQLAAPLEQLALFLDDPWVELDYGEASDEDSSQRPLVAIHPGSGSPSKNWSLEGWADICSRIVREYPDASFLVISGEAEETSLGDMLGLLTEKGIPFESLDQLSLGDVARRIARADLFLGHDSGISHLAASTGVPGFLLFGPTNPEIWAPTHPAFSSLRAPGGELGNLGPGEVWNHPEFAAKLEHLA